VKLGSALRTAVIVAIAASAWISPSSAGAARHYSLRHVVAVLDLVTQHLAPHIDTYHTRDGCEIDAIMTTREQIHVYVNAGDEVLTNPGHTVGIKVVDAPARCVRELRRGLKKLP
jgi:hypothetical protein